MPKSRTRLLLPLLLPLLLALASYAFAATPPVKGKEETPQKEPAHEPKKDRPVETSCPRQTFKSAWGINRDGFGSDKEGEFNYPHGIAIDKREGKKAIYVADTKNYRVQKFSLKGEFLKSWKLNENKGEYDTSRGMAVDSDGNLYVAMESAETIRKYSPEGELLKTWSVKDPAVDVPKGQHSGAWDIAISAKNEIFAVYPNGGEVAVFDPDGKRLRTIGRGILPRYGPIGIGISPDQKLYVEGQTGAFGGKVDVFSLDGKEKPKRFTDKTFGKVYDIEFDPFGDAYVVDHFRGTVSRFDKTGKFLYELEVPEKERLRGPRHLVIDGCTLYLADGNNHRVVVFGPK